MKNSQNDHRSDRNVTRDLAALGESNQGILATVASREIVVSHGGGDRIMDLCMTKLGAIGDLRFIL